MSARDQSFSAIKPERFSLKLTEGDVAGWRWPNPEAPRLLFCHANGFCASAYKRMLDDLASLADIYAIDLRGHGRTTLPAAPGVLKRWNIFGRDVAAVLDAMRPGADAQWILAGHSMGAVSSVLAAQGRSDIASLILIEPVALPPVTAFLANTLWSLAATKSSLARGALARRSSWPSRDAVAASYRRKRLFQSWAPGVLEDYLEDGLEDYSGEARLSCSPDWEAAAFSRYATGFWRAVKTAPAPMSVLGGERNSTIFPGSAASFRRSAALFRVLPGAGHLLPMEKPAEAAAFIAEAAELRP